MQWHVNYGDGTMSEARFVTRPLGGVGAVVDMGHLEALGRTEMICDGRVWRRL